MSSQPGWYPDPRGGAGWRYWDGLNWTEHTAPRGQPVPAETGPSGWNGIIARRFIGFLADYVIVFLAVRVVVELVELVSPEGSWVGWLTFALLFMGWWGYEQVTISTRGATVGMRLQQLRLVPGGAAEPRIWLRSAFFAIAFSLLAVPLPVEFVEGSVGQVDASSFPALGAQLLLSTVFWALAITSIVLLAMSKPLLQDRLSRTRVEMTSDTVSRTYSIVIIVVCCVFVAVSMWLATQSAIGILQGGGFPLSP